MALTACPWFCGLPDDELLTEELIVLELLTDDTLDPVELEEEVSLDELRLPTANRKHDRSARRASNVPWPIVTTLLWYVARHALTLTLIGRLLEELVVLLELETLCAIATEPAANERPMAAPVMRVRKGVFIEKRG